MWFEFELGEATISLYLIGLYLGSSWGWIQLGFWLELQHVKPFASQNYVLHCSGFSLSFLIPGSSFHPSSLVCPLTLVLSLKNTKVVQDILMNSLLSLFIKTIPICQYSLKRSFSRWNRILSFFPFPGSIPSSGYASTPSIPLFYLLLLCVCSGKGWLLPQWLF